MKEKIIWVNILVGSDDKFCSESCPMIGETSSNDECHAFNKLLKFDVESYRWYRCSECLQHTIGG